MSSLLVHSLKQGGQDLLLKGMAHLYGVSQLVEVSPRLGEHHAEDLQCLVAFSVGEVTGPDPLYAQGRLPPPLCGLPIAISHSHAYPRAGYGGECLRSELQRNAGFDG